MVSCDNSEKYIDISWYIREIYRYIMIYRSNISIHHDISEKYIDTLWYIKFFFNIDCFLYSYVIIKYEMKKGFLNLLGKCITNLLVSEWCHSFLNFSIWKPLFLVNIRFTKYNTKHVLFHVWPLYDLERWPKV